MPMHLRSRILRGLALGSALLAAAAAQAQIPYNISYQGQLEVDGQPFSGDADFKFALLCGSSPTSVWSNDDSSVGGSEPATAVTLPVAEGLFSVRLGQGDLGMVAIHPDMLDACPGPTLRVWVDTGAGFEQLSDQPLASSPYAMVSEAAYYSLGTFTVYGGNLDVRDGHRVQVRTAAGATRIALDGPSGSVECDTLKFGDGTRMSTAAGPGGTDNDWIVDGNNMSSGVSGNVGIGTASPGTKVHVIGDVRVDGTNGNGIDSRNPNWSAAILRFGWLNDIARIRIGGNGAGSNAGLDIQGTSDTSLLRILNNGNIGMGTTAPTARLEVVGNAVITGNLTVQGAISGGGAGGYLAIPASAFLEAEANQMDVHRSSVLLHGRTAGQGLTFEAPVFLPDGATITEFRVYLTDSDPTIASGRNVQTFLMQDPLGTVGTPVIIATLSTTGAPGSITLTSAALNHVVDNANNAYVVTANWTTPNGGVAVTALAVNGVRVAFTAP